MQHVCLKFAELAHVSTVLMFFGGAVNEVQYYFLNITYDFLSNQARHLGYLLGSSAI